MNISLKFAQFILIELKTLTDLPVEILDMHWQQLASTLPSSQSYANLQDSSFRDGYAFADVQPGPGIVMVLNISHRGEDVCYVALYGKSKEKLRALRKPIAKIMELYLDKEMEHGSAKHLRGRKNALFEDLIQMENISEEVVQRGAALGIHLQVPHMLIVFSLCQKRYKAVGELNEFPDHVLQSLMRSFEGCFGEEGVVISTRTKIVVIVPERDPIPLKALLSSILDDVKVRWGSSICAGISRPTGQYGDYYKLHKTAATICKIASFREAPGVYLQNELLLELLIENIPQSVKREYVHHVFKDGMDADLEEWERIVATLHKNNGSISKSSEELYIHKNTLQYRLNRIRERTGYDARSAKEALFLQIAFMARNSALMEELD